MVILALDSRYGSASDASPEINLLTGMCLRMCGMPWMRAAVSPCKCRHKEKESKSGIERWSTQSSEISRNIKMVHEALAQLRLVGRHESWPRDTGKAVVYFFHQMLVVRDL